jgi:hypothetical protein
MGKSWEPKTVNHTELRAQSVGIVGPAMVLAVFLMLLFGIAIMMYAFAGVQLGGGDLIETMEAFGTVAARLGHLSDFFTLGHFWSFLVNAIVPSIVVLFAFYVYFAVRRMPQDG